MHWIDWLIVISLFTAITAIAYWTKRFNQNVTDFLSANRCAGRYVLALAEVMAMVGAISFVEKFEQFYISGFAVLFWGQLLGPLPVFVTLIGWIIYRFRQTRALTLAQFFEMRYSRNFRIFAGTILFVAGIINFGIFPGIGAKFFINFLNLPPYFELFGIELSTFVSLMAGLLTLAVMITLWGGQISIMVTDFLQGTILLFVMVAIVLLYYHRYDINTTIYETIIQRAPGESLINPFDTGKQSFNFWFFMVVFITLIYNYKNWQNTQGYNTSAKSPHEARMSGILGSFRLAAFNTVVVFIPICAYIAMHHPSFSGLADSISSSLSSVQGEKLQGQMITPIFLSKTLPIGLMGLFVGVVFFAFVSTHDTFLHSWASVLVQDILVPLRGKPLEAKQHKRWLILAIIGTALFVLLWSYFFTFEEHIGMYWMITSAIFLGGSGSVVIGGLYWKRGTTPAAYAAMIIGGVLSGGGLIFRYFNSDFPLSVATINAIAIGSSIISYVLISLLGPKQNFNMDKMLHRGKYAIESNTSTTASKQLPKWKKCFAITKEFTKSDIIIYFLAIAQVLVWFFVGWTMLALYFIAPKFGYAIGNKQWFLYWKIYLSYTVVLSIVSAIWFLIGGTIDLKDMFKTLSKARRNSLDDGWVENHHNSSDKSLLTKTLDDKNNDK